MTLILVKTIKQKYFNFLTKIRAFLNTKIFIFTNDSARQYKSKNKIFSDIICNLVFSNKKLIYKKIEILFAQVVISINVF